MSALKDLLISIAEQNGIDPSDISESDMERVLVELSELQLDDDPFYNAIIASIDRGNSYYEPDQQLLA